MGRSIQQLHDIVSSPMRFCLLYCPSSVSCSQHAPISCNSMQLMHVLSPPHLSGGGVPSVSSSPRGQSGSGQVTIPVVTSARAGPQDVPVGPGDIQGQYSFCPKAHCHVHKAPSSSLSNGFLGIHLS